MSLVTYWLIVKVAERWWVMELQVFVASYGGPGVGDPVVMLRTWTLQ